MVIIRVKQKPLNPAWQGLQQRDRQQQSEAVESGRDISRHYQRCGGGFRVLRKKIGGE